MLSLPTPPPLLYLPKAGTHLVKSKGSLSFHLTLGPGSQRETQPLVPAPETWVDMCWQLGLETPPLEMKWNPETSTQSLGALEQVWPPCCASCLCLDSHRLSRQFFTTSNQSLSWSKVGFFSAGLLEKAGNGRSDSVS